MNDEEEDFRKLTFSPLRMRDTVSDFVKSNGWEELVTTVPGTAQIKMLYKSPLTGNYHSLSFALGMIFEKHGIPAA